MRNFVGALMIGMVLISCTNNEKKAESKRIEQINIHEKMVINNLKEKFGIIYQWDTLTFDYSVDYKPVIESNFFMINDIYEKNDELFLSVKTGFYHSFYFDFPITRDQELFFRKIEDRWSDSFFIVVSMHAVNKIRIKIESEADIQGDDNSSWVVSWNKMDASEDFFGTGEIVEIIPIME